MDRANPRSAAVIELLCQAALSDEGIAKRLGIRVSTVLGIKRRYERGQYAPLAPRTQAASSKVRTDRGWTYLLVSNSGATYVGASTDLRGRLRAHNAKCNRGWTRGQTWHLLGVIRFSSRAQAFEMETWFKKSGNGRGEWIETCLSRAFRLAQRHDLGAEWVEALTARSRSLQPERYPQASPSSQMSCADHKSTPLPERIRAEPGKG